MQENDYIILLIKRFSGEIQPDESRLLEDWINQSPRHARLAEQYQMIWNTSAAPPQTFELDLEAEFQRLRQHIADQTERPKVRVISLGRQLLRVAAALLFLIAAIWGYRTWTYSSLEWMEVSAGNLPKRQVELPDGSRVWLRQNSTLSYPKSFVPSERRIKLTGEAYFEVTHNAGRPFRVELPQGGIVEVVGTAFCVRAPQNPSETLVLVRSGKVRFSPGGKNDGPLLTTHQMAVYNRETAQIKISEVSTFNELAWQSGGLEFLHTPLKNVLTDLEKYYHVEITLRNPELANCPYTSPLTNQSIDQVLRGLSATYQLEISKPATGVFILSGGTCR